jgi:hypothetical protein
MKQKQSLTSEANVPSKRVEHKLAHYTAKGDLVCLLCKTPVKSSALWVSHCASASHKQKLELLAQMQRQQSAAKEAAASLDPEAAEPSAKRPKFEEPSSSEMHHSTAPTADSQITHVPLPPEDGTSNEEILKALRAEWEEQEASIVQSEKMDQTNSEELDLEPLPNAEDESDDDNEEYDGQITEDDLLMAKHAEHRLTLLQGQKESMMQSAIEEEDLSDSQSDEDSESSEDVDVNDLYNWRSRAV